MTRKEKKKLYQESQRIYSNKSIRIRDTYPILSLLSVLLLSPWAETVQVTVTPFPFSNANTNPCIRSVFVPLSLQWLQSFYSPKTPRSRNSKEQLPSPPPIWSPTTTAPSPRTLGPSRVTTEVLLTMSSAMLMPPKLSPTQTSDLPAITGHIGLLSIFLLLLLRHWLLSAM